jgi:hypothetical protein
MNSSDESIFIDKAIIFLNYFSHELQMICF